MPITLDPSLPPSLYPLAWLVGSWRGDGALHEPGTDGRRVEQTLTCEAREDGTLGWSCRVDVIDTPAPLPPTSAFARDDAPAAPAPAGTGERRPLLRESGTWTVGEPLPGQDLERAAAAAPGDPAATVSHALRADLDGDAPAGGTWAGEVRGPRIQLALRPDDDGSPVLATRLFGYVGGRLLWIWERRTGDDLSPYLSLELDRV